MHRITLGKERKEGKGNSSATFLHHHELNYESCLAYQHFISLRSKRFRLVSEQKKTEERDSRFWPHEK